MNRQLVKASHEHAAVIKNLMQFYMYDFSEYTKADVEEDGLFAAYPHLEDYWKETAHRFPYLMVNNGRYAGFVLVRFIETGPRNYFSIAEFFVMKHYRREGIGNTMAKQIFNLHRGHWKVFQMESNKPAQLFWSQVIGEYTEGRFAERSENGRTIQEFEN